MNAHDPIPRLRIGMIGSGFIANFHLQALVSVRHVTVAGIYSPNAAHREALAAKANALELVVSGVYSPSSANREVLWNSARAGRFRRSKPC